MSDETESSAVPRSASCQAKSIGKFSACERCGLAWDPQRGAAPACNVMTPKRLRRALVDLVCRLDASHGACVELSADDPRVDPLPSLVLATEANSILRFVDRVLAVPEILDILKNRKRPADHG